MIDVSFEIYQHFQGHHRYHFLYQLAFTFGIQTLLMTHYFLARKFIFFSKIFACLQTLICTIGITEKALVSGTLSNSAEEIDIFIILLAIVASISVTSYCQRSIFMASMFSWIYLINRIHHLYLGNTYRWLRFALFYLGSLFCIYTFSRAFQQRERD